MKRKEGMRLRGKDGNEQSSNFTKTASLLSVNGNLRSLYYDSAEEVERSTGYTPLQIGKPLVVRYRYFFLKLDNAGDKEQEVMISTFLKTEEEKKAAAEAVNYYNPGMIFTDKLAEVKHFGGDVYGHELIYYTKSFLGEPIKITTKIMELDNLDKSIKEISKGIGKLGKMPFFAEYLPYVAMVQKGTGLIGKIFRILDRDDPIVPGLRMDLFFNIPHTAKLQCGRIVCIQGKSEQEILDCNLKLSKENWLVYSDGRKYSEASYFVVQINSEEHTSYEDFEYFQNAAELLALTNNQDGIKDFIDTATEGFKTYADISTISQMEDLRDDLEDPDSKKKFKAMFKGLSGEVKDIYRDKYKDILAESGD